MVTVHVGDVPEHAPTQPANCEPEEGAAVSVTVVPHGYKEALGLLVIVPDPVPFLVTLST